MKPHTPPIQPFSGFAPGKVNGTRVPDPFFSELLPIIDDLAELKLTLYCFWALQQREGEYRYVRRRDMLDDALLLRGFGDDDAVARRELDRALERASSRGTLLPIILQHAALEDHLYFMNTERGRKAVEALERGDWQPGADDVPIVLIHQQPNIFALYEANIGPLTPMLSDILKDAEQTYPLAWISEAMQIAVERNIRNWRYVESILKRWYTEGKKDGSVRSNAPKDRGTAGIDPTDYERYWDRE